MFLSYCKNSSFGFVFWACLLKENTIYYLHVFLFVGSSDKSHCTELAKYLQTLCRYTYNSNKSEGPASKLFGVCV